MLKAFDKLLGPMFIIGLVSIVLADSFTFAVIVLLALGISLIGVSGYNIRSGGMVFERSNDRHRRRDTRGVIVGLLSLGAGLVIWKIGPAELQRTGNALIVGLGVFGIILTTLSPAKSGSKAK